MKSAILKAHGFADSEAAVDSTDTYVVPNDKPAPAKEKK